MACLPLMLPAQIFINNEDINQKPDLQYIELIIDLRLFTRGEVSAVIDYGQVIRPGTLRQHRVKDKLGNDRLFGSEIDIFNFLFKNGWIHETTYAVGQEGCIYHIFRRKSFLPVAGE